MKIGARVRILNFFRNVFRIPVLERWLVRRTVGKPTHAFFSKLAPNPYQYASGSWRAIQRNGIAIEVDVSDYIGHILFFGFRDPGLEQLFTLCKPQATVLDVGSNIGWTLLNLSRCAPHGKVLGLEPDPVNFERCKANLERNDFSNVSVYPIGLGEAAQTVLMETRTPFNRGGNRVAPSNQTSGVRIKIMRMDDFLGSVGVQSVNLIKIDVEGYELKVLRGGEETLRRCKPVLFIEIDESNLVDQGDSAVALVDYLRSMGYTQFYQAVDGTLVDENFDFAHCHFDLIAR